MEIGIVDGVRLLTLDLVATTTLAGILLILGNFIRKKIPKLKEMCIPASVIGGLLFAVLVWALRSANLLKFDFDTTLQTPFMIAFFATVGFSGSFKLLKSGGKSLFKFLVLMWGMAMLQNIFGVGLAKLLDIQPVLGVMAGAVSLVGGHGNAAAFGEVAELAGVTGALTLAIAAATYGLIVGSLLGGPVANYLIKKNNIKIETEDVGVSREDLENESPSRITADKTLNHMAIVGIFMVLGGLLGKGINTGAKAIGIKNFSLPGYVGAMFVAIIFRNLNEKFEITEVDEDSIDFIQSISLGLFLTMAIMTLRIWELAELALPLIIILVSQTVLTLLVAYFVVWPFMGRNYDAATMVAGFLGGALGVTATAIANMSAVNERYDERSIKAMLVVPLCCAVFVDIVAIPSILFFIGKFA